MNTCPQCGRPVPRAGAWCPDCIDRGIDALDAWWRAAFPAEIAALDRLAPLPDRASTPAATPTTSGTPAQGAAPPSTAAPPPGAPRAPCDSSP